MEVQEEEEVAVELKIGVKGKENHEVGEAAGKEDEDEMIQLIERLAIFT